MPDDKPEIEYGEWTRGNAGQVGRTVTDFYWSDILGEWLPVVDWQPHPDEEGGGHPQSASKKTAGVGRYRENGAT